jgi:hypothetical protein
MRSSMTDECIVCGTVTHHPAAYACKRCKKILERADSRRDETGAVRRFDRPTRIRALQEAWRDGAFHCHYTGVRLVEDPKRWRDHRYLSFEHQTPGDESSVVVTCSLVNRMKTDLSDAQFRAMVSELATVFAGSKFDKSRFPEGKRPAGASD